MMRIFTQLAQGKKVWALDFSITYAQGHGADPAKQLLAPGASSFDAKDNFMRKDDSNTSTTTQRRCLNNY
jgi:hypothetical protein